MVPSTNRTAFSACASPPRIRSKEPSLTYRADSASVTPRFPAGPTTATTSSISSASVRTIRSTTVSTGASWSSAPGSWATMPRAIIRLALAPTRATTCSLWEQVSSSEGANPAPPLHRFLEECRAQRDSASVFFSAGSALCKALLLRNRRQLPSPPAPLSVHFLKGWTVSGRQRTPCP